MANQEKKRYTGEVYGIAGFVLGVASIILSIGINITFIPIFAILFGIIGLALSIKQQISKKTGLGLAGIILSSIGIVLAVIVSWLFIDLLKKMLAELERLKEANSALGALGSGQLGNLNVG